MKYGILVSLWLYIGEIVGSNTTSLALVNKPLGTLFYVGKDWNWPLS